jgi:hypothetical protein
LSSFQHKQVTRSENGQISFFNADEIQQCRSCSWTDATASTGEVLFSRYSLGCPVHRWTWEVGPVFTAWAWVDHQVLSRLVYAVAFSCPLSTPFPI